MRLKLKTRVTSWTPPPAFQGMHDDARAGLAGHLHVIPGNAASSLTAPSKPDPRHTLAKPLMSNVTSTSRKYQLLCSEEIFLGQLRTTTKPAELVPALSKSPPGPGQALRSRTQDTEAEAALRLRVWPAPPPAPFLGFPQDRARELTPHCIGGSCVRLEGTEGSHQGPGREVGALQCVFHRILDS